MAKRMPAFGRQFAPVLPGIGLLIFGPNAWEPKQTLVPNGVILPPYEDPKEFEWRMFRDRKVYARGWGKGITEDECKKLALHVLLAGAKYINISTNHPYRTNEKGQYYCDENLESAINIIIAND